LEDKIKELEKKQEAELKKFAEMIDHFGAELHSFRRFLDALMNLLLGVVLTEEPVERLAMLLKASTFLPLQIRNMYVEESIRRAVEAKMPFDDFVEAVTKSLGDGVKDLELTRAIKRYYGLDSVEKWKKIIGDSNPSKDCKMKVMCHE